MDRCEQLWNSMANNYGYTIIVCMVFRPTREFSTLVRRQHYRRRVANFDLCLALTFIEQWWFFMGATPTVTQDYFIMVISEDPSYSHQLPSVWQWSYHWLFYRCRSVTSTRPSACGAIVLGLPVYATASADLLWKTMETRVLYKKL